MGCKGVYITRTGYPVIRRALRTKVRVAEQIYEHEDVVYYKRDGKDWWLGGPANEVFQDGKVVFVRHGGVFVRVSPNRLSKAENMKNLTDEVAEDQTHGEQSENQTDQDKGTIKDRVDFQVSETLPAEEVPEQNATDKHAKIENEVRHRDIVQPDTIKVNNTVGYRIDNEWVSGTILGRAGKSTVKYNTWYNVRDENNQERSIDLSNLEWEKVPETEINIKAEYDDTRANDIIKAKENKLNNLA